MGSVNYEVKEAPDKWCNTCMGKGYFYLNKDDLRHIVTCGCIKERKVYKELVNG